MSKRSGWTPERKQRQREAIERWKPWESSTGPRSAAGKAQSSQNAMKHGLRSAEERELLQMLRDALREQRARLSGR